MANGNSNGQKQRESLGQKIQNASTNLQTIKRSDFSFSDGTADEESEIATYEIPRDLKLRSDKPVRVMIPAKESVTTDGSGSQTISLSNNFVSSPNTQDIYILSNEDGSGDIDTVVEPTSTDPANDEFDYDDGGSAENLEIYYIARDPGQIEIKKVAPETQGTVEEVIFEEPSSLIHEQDQYDEPLYLNLNQSLLQDVVPEDWDLVVEVDLPYTATFDVANALLSIPARYIQGEFEGLDEAVAHDIIDRGN